MAKQIAGLCFLEGTFDALTFYKMEGQHYCRAKSSLTSERVKKSKEFERTMALANLMARASKIGSTIYKALPENWRQFWMYRSFTGEALILLKYNPYTDEEVTRILWKTYVEYWEQWEAANKTGTICVLSVSSVAKGTGASEARPDLSSKQKPIRKTRKYSLESLLRQKDKSGKPKWRNLEEEERKRIEKEKQQALYQRTLENERQQAKQKEQIQTKEVSPIKIERSSWIVTDTGQLIYSLDPRLHVPVASLWLVTAIYKPPACDV